MSTQAKFWFVWNRGGNTPRYEHDTRASAVAEAERLARLHGGQEFVVLESIASVRVTDVQWARHDPEYPSQMEDSDDDLPF